MTYNECTGISGYCSEPGEGSTCNACHCLNRYTFREDTGVCVFHYSGE